jgi:ATP-dependent Zn protease
MIRPKMMHILMLCLISFGTIIPSEISTAQEPQLTATQQAQLAEIAEFAEKAINKAFSSLQNVENILTEIAILVGQGIVKGDTRQIMAILTDNKITINTLLQNQPAIMALDNPFEHLKFALLITNFCNEFIPYLDDNVKNNFKNARPFDIEAFSRNAMKRAKNSQNLNPEQLRKHLKETKNSLQTLRHSVKNMGLTWYNKAARKLDSYVVTPAVKWHVPTVLYYGAFTGLTAFYTLWRYGYYVQDNPIVPLSLRKFIKKQIAEGGPFIHTPNGHVYTIARSTGPATSDTQSANVPKNNETPEFHTDSPAMHNGDNTEIISRGGLLAVSDLILNDILSNTNPLEAIMMTSLYASFSTMWNGDKEAPGVKDKIAKKIDGYWNFMRGGEYLKIKNPGLVQMRPTVSFKDMVGLDEIKKEFTQILQYIDNPEQLQRLQATPEKGWLLTGPTRTGKSFSVECLCGEIELLMHKRGKANTIKFFNITANLVNKFGIKDILEEVKENAPAVIFIDEIDLLGLQRVGNNALLSEFLTAMQSSMNADPNKVVIVIAATNNPENIDKALRQNGRFGKEIRFEYPSKKYRMQYIERELLNMALDVRQFDIEALADKTNNRSFEDLHRVVSHAMKCARLHGKALTQELFEEAILTELHHIIISNRKDLPEDELRIVATHFAGKALAALYLPTHEQLDKVTIYARMTDLKEELVWQNYDKKDEKDYQTKIEYGHMIFRQGHDSINLKKEATIINEAIILLAGFAAEELLLNSCGYTCHSLNREKAFKLIEDMVFGGLKKDALPKSTREELKAKAYALFQKCQTDAMTLLQNHKDALVTLVDELIQKQLLDEKEVRAIVDKTKNASTEMVEAK